MSTQSAAAEAVGLEMIEDLGALGMVRSPIDSASDESRFENANRRANVAGKFENLTVMTGLDGSKQPQDFGVNATLGGRSEINWAVPVYEPLGLALQLGTATVASDNAVRVFELLGEKSDRFQQYVTVGGFQRTENGFAWGVVHDFLYENLFDTVKLGQWRTRASLRAGNATELGMTAILRSFGDDAMFNTTTVRLRPINQASLYIRQFFETGVQGTFWAGVADEHGESNVVTGPSRAINDAFLFGADILAPLSRNFAIYGETNLMMPADTGTVCAFMALAWYPSGNAKVARRTRYSALLPVASCTSFSVDLLP